jgi:2-polyprenyl-6-hydroxyphenyl methylase/3-demethylubiquinone-9 3-methyltransferase
LSGKAPADRFAFGQNWRRFLSLLSEERILAAEKSLQEMLDVTDLHGRTFLDVGSGSGLFSLAARRLGARVHSFDFDPQSVACTGYLRQHYCADDAGWTVEQGSALDRAYIQKLGKSDVLYSWGVLHHTGQMWEALGCVADAVAPKGQLFIAIYNDQGWLSSYWRRVKSCYVKYPVSRWLLVLLHAPYLFGVRFLVRTLAGRRKVDRGMTLWHDMIDWVGGYPFEVAKPEQILHFYVARGFSLREMRTCGGRNGCNQFVFVRNS